MISLQNNKNYLNFIFKIVIEVFHLEVYPCRTFGRGNREGKKIFEREGK